MTDKAARGQAFQMDLSSWKPRGKQAAMANFKTSGCVPQRHSLLLASLFGHAVTISPQNHLRSLTSDACSS